MSEKILVAIDESNCSRRALNVAVKHARRTGDDLLLAYVIEWTPYSFLTPEELDERHQKRDSEIQRANESVLADARAVAVDEGLKVETVARHGKVAKTLVELAKEHGASQIYVGKHGESLLHSMIFGSVTTTLIQTSEIPVTVVP